MTNEEITKYFEFPFDTTINSIDTNIDTINAYNFKQIILSKKNDNKTYFDLIDNNVKFKLQNSNFNSNNENILVICSKNYEHILNYSLNKLQTYDILKKYDILLIDDRSSNDSILKLSHQFKTSYVRIDSTLNIFNYSLINNIAACYAKKFHKKNIIFYNNDLWPTNEKTLDNLLDKHHQYKSCLTGCRLLYPSETEYNALGKPQHVLNDHLRYAYNTIQHGGIYFFPRMSHYEPNKISLAPNHLWRFYSPSNVLSMVDNRCFAVTGAINIISTENFIDIKGFNMGLCSSFQDIDLCLKIVAKKLPIYYIGTESLIHAESLSRGTQENNNDTINLSDNILWDFLWNNKIYILLGYNEIC